MIIYFNLVYSFVSNIIMLLQRIYPCFLKKKYMISAKFLKRSAPVLKAFHEMVWLGRGHSHIVK